MPPVSITWPKIQSICHKSDAFQGVKHYLTPFTEACLDWPTVDDMNRITKELQPEFPWTFVEQKKVPRRAKSRGLASLSGYVSLISSQGKIPFRLANAHDFLNCLSFLLFPQSKLQLNKRHHFESPQGLKSGENRTRTQDLLTVFDEGGVIRLTVPGGCHHDLIFGHALFEHILKDQRVRAARLDLAMEMPLTSQYPKDLYKTGDLVFAAWLESPHNCRSSSEFSNIWIDP